MQNDDQEKRLRELREQRAKIEEAMEARERGPELSIDELIAAEEQKLKEAERIAELQLEHGAGRLMVLDTDAGTLVVKRPHHLHYKRFVDGEITTETAHRLVMACAVYPEKPRFETALEEYPGLVDRITGQLHKLATGRRQEVRGK